jgi:hypothetical protein
MEKMNVRLEERRKRRKKMGSKKEQFVLMQERAGEYR